MNDKKIIKLIFTELTPIFWSMYSIQGVQLDALTQVDHIQLVPITRLNRLFCVLLTESGSLGRSATFLMNNATQWYYFNNPR